MKLKRDVAMTLLLQGGGGAATLLAALWLGRMLGPAQQGQFNQMKSLVDLGAALAALGMPQALYVYAQSRRIGLADARRLSLRVALLGLPVGLALAWWNGVGDAAAALAAAVALACLHAQWRALTLLADATWRFNLVTVVPQLLLLPLAGWIVLSGGVPAAAVGAALALVWLAGSWYAGAALSRIPAQPGPAVPLADLARHGLATWATASLATLGIVLLQRQAQAVGGPAGLGAVSLALLLVQVPLTPLNYALPLLLRHRLQEPAGRALARHLPLVVLPILLLALGVAALGNWRDDLWLGAGYAGVHRVLGWLMLAGAAEAALRVVAVDAQAEGRPWRSTWAEGARVLVLLALVHGAAAPAGVPGVVLPADALALWWAVAAWAAVAVFWWSGRGAEAAR